MLININMSSQKNSSFSTSPDLNFNSLAYSAAKHVANGGRMA